MLAKPPNTFPDPKTCRVQRRADGLFDCHGLRGSRCPYCVTFDDCLSLCRCPKVREILLLTGKAVN